MIRLAHLKEYSSTLLQVLSLIKGDVKFLTNCSQQLQISDINQVNPETNSASVSETSLIFHPLDEFYSNNTSIQSFYHRFSLACSVVLFDVEQNRNSFKNPNAINPYGSSNPAYEIFIDSHRHVDFQVFAAMTKKIPLAFLLQQTDSDLFELYQPQPGHQALKFITKFNSHASSTCASIFTKSSPDYQGATLNVTTCDKCDGAVELYKMTDRWVSWSEAILWELSVRINATMNFIPVPSSPRLEPVNGEWDDWVAPLSEGTGSIACHQPYSRSRLHAFYYADPVDFDHVTFVTRRPQRIHTAGFSRLLSPFSHLVWIGSCCSILFLFIFIMLLICFHQSVPHAHKFLLSLKPSRLVLSKKETPRPSYHLTILSILLKPMISQASSHHQFEGKMMANSTEKFLCALWLLVSMVLVSMYQSELTSDIVMPEYSKPPEDFLGLADSKFQLNAIMWGGNMEADFRSANVSFSQKFIDTVQEFDYSEPHCYMKIFEGDNACIGFHGTFQDYGFIFLLDIKGRMLFLESKDARFARTLTYAISKNNFDLKEPLNYIIQSTLASGAMESWARNLFSVLKQVGIDHAQRSKERWKIYTSFEKDESDSIVPLLLEFGIWGHGLATCALICENLTKLCQRLGTYVLRLHK